MSFSASFEQEIISLAKQIAWNNRETLSKDWADPNTPELQPVGALEQKFNAELLELRLADEPWDELPDVCYYAVCLNYYGSTLALEYILTHVPELFDVSLAQIEAGTLAKYRIRASGIPKDIMTERAAILAAVANA